MLSKSSASVHGRPRDTTEYTSIPRLHIRNHGLSAPSFEGRPSTRILRESQKLCQLLLQRLIAIMWLSGLFSREGILLALAYGPLVRR